MRYWAVVILVSATVMTLAGCKSSASSSGHSSAQTEVYTGPHVHKVTLPDEMLANAKQPPSLPPGAKMAVIEGDPTKPGFICARLYMPDGYKIPPHTHPNWERVTVISGTLLLCEGSDMNKPDKVDTLTAGSYTTMSPGMVHFGIAKGDTVLQLTTMGPWNLTYINPADDPRNQKK